MSATLWTARGMIVALVLLSSSFAHADEGFADPNLGYLNAAAFPVTEQLGQLSLAGVSDFDIQDVELLAMARVAGYSAMGSRSLGRLTVGRTRVRVGLAEDAGAWDRVATLDVDLRPVAFSLLDVLRVELLPVRIGREQRINRDFSVNARLVGLEAQAPLLGDVGGETASLVFHGSISALGFRRENYFDRTDDTFNGLELADVDLALSLLVGESPWGTRSSLSAVLTGGVSWAGAVGSVGRSSVDWMREVGSFGDLRVHFWNNVAVFGRARWRRVGDSANDNGSVRRDLLAGLIVLL